jgi:hypothetical protein
MYKITTSVDVHILPYMEEDENIIGVTCYETLPQMKLDLLGRLDYLASKINDLTLKRIKEGIKL